jgi:protein-tyrosine phosphatase
MPERGRPGEYDSPVQAKPLGLATGSRLGPAASNPGGRFLRWDGCVNVRDLGGLPLASGGETAYRVVVRADALPALSVAGREALLAYGVSVVIDLRASHEFAADSSEALPVPVRREPIDPREVPDVQTWPSIREAYLALIDRFGREFARALTALGAAEVPAAVHCQSGRDRTGIACGMALWLAGVTPEAIATDHAFSDASLESRNQAWFASAPDEQERARRRRVAAPAQEVLASVLQEVDQREGIRALLLRNGADRTALDRLSKRLRGAP